jgi:hypothetical protein
MVLYKMSTISGEFRVILITLGLQLYIHKEFNYCSFFFIFLIVIIDTFLFCYLYSIPVSSEGNIVDHIAAKHKLAWCCLQCCVIFAFNSMVTMYFWIGQMDYHVVLLYFHSCFPSQIVYWQPTSLYTLSMTEFACT